MIFLQTLRNEVALGRALINTGLLEQIELLSVEGRLLDPGNLQYTQEQRVVVYFRFLVEGCR